jgi:hypothetical protein
MALITGWDRSTWNSGTWNSPVPVEVTGVSAASAIGSATVSIDSSFSVTGVSAASAIGSVSVFSAVLIIPTGVSAAGSLGSATAITNSNLSITGVSAASGIGSVQMNFAFTVDGVSATSTVSQTTVWSEIDTSQTPNWTKIAA